MSAPQSRAERRQAERQTIQLAKQILKDNAAAAVAEPSRQTPDKRAAANQANATLSTGPRSASGKAISSQNAFKHGLYSKQLVSPLEDAAELDQLRADLRADHQPANTTEEILVNEMAEQFWRLKRMRRLEGVIMNHYDRFDDWFNRLPHMQRAMSAAERGFYKAHAELQKLQQARGFVPAISKPAPPAESKNVESTNAESENGFVSTIPAPSQAPQPPTPGFVPANPGKTVHPAAKEPQVTQQIAA